MRFTHESLCQRVVFASEAAAGAVAAEIRHLGAQRLMVVAAPAESDLAASVTVGLPVVRWHDEVVMHVPVEVAQRARDVAASARVDAVVCVGGGSTTGLAKALAMSGSPVAGLPIVAVPTTYAGSEATNVWGLTEPGPDGGTKRTGVDGKVLPCSIVYDASLMLTLPPELTVASGFNALAHGVDAMWGPRADPINRLHATEGVRVLAAALPRIVEPSSGPLGRKQVLYWHEQTLYGAYLAAVAFASAGSGMHHKICHVLGGMFNLPHAQTHAVVLPHVLAFNAPNAPEATDRLARAFGSSTALVGLRDLRTRVEAPTALRDYGMPEDGIATAVAPVLAAIPANNPTTVNENNITALLHAAWAGEELR